MSAIDARSERQQLRVFLIVGEESGDRLGASLMQALRTRLGNAVTFAGVGGTAMAREGLKSLFPLTDISLFGFVQVLTRLPLVIRRLRETACAVVQAAPDVLVIIDSPDFTQRVARRVHALAPQIPIVNYVSPSVWAWRPGRARAMSAYIDHVMALLPFEPAVHARLGGPACTYVGHPLVEEVQSLRPSDEEAFRRDGSPPRILVLPGSRRSEIERLMQPFGEALARLDRLKGPLDLVLPTLPHVADLVRARAEGWTIKPRIILDPLEKRAAFRTARAALAASGTVTLELALAGVPTVAAYRVAALEAVFLRRVIQVPTVILSNLVLGENIVPEFLQQDCTPQRLADALAPLLDETPERARQTDAFARLDGIMEIGRERPSERAAEIVIAAAGR